ncbi:AraC family transcriptional regulator [Marispirochaeta aestuarii]|uniref:AraC family transcriptional regulator n=1 Tax=Marispirochaeta aestuarii TaxID=1963862 RepID=UPI0029C7DFBE|nr:AraC family transcriptional regulator [Marispirochaeta aestuarii]
MNREFYERQEGFHLAIKARLYDLALVLLRSVPARQVSESELIRRNLRNQVLNKIFSYIHENFGQDISLEEAAASVHLSKFYFSRFFRSQTGQTFHAYLNRVRISHAEDLLADTELPVTEVAYQSGFGSIKTFNRQFRTATGTSPSRYRAGER